MLPSCYYRVEAPRAELRRKVDWIGAFPLGEEPLRLSLLELFTGECALWCRLSPIVLLALPSAPS